ncbi:hypothetical protein [Novosphingobium sp. B1]|jgi:hypothetical protein|uniref:hypothetical protein n=1 Tax=Novosphingobium sp. B1 TaxID=1938756 RepID=UPI0009D7F5DE|nr:hypothetical protein [Novosphingobium sp. B1]SMD00077.1 hypothetical protein SAMN06272759_11818 [Novosphingobium sp. B1]
MLSVADQYARNRKVIRRHHYILLMKSSDGDMTKHVELFAADVDEALEWCAKTRTFHEVEIWEDGRSRGVRHLHS